MNQALFLLIVDIGRIKEETREVNLNGDDKRFWLHRWRTRNEIKEEISLIHNSFKEL